MPYFQKNKKDKAEVLFLPFPVPCPCLQQQGDTCSESSISSTQPCFLFLFHLPISIKWHIILFCLLLFDYDFSKCLFFHPTSVCLQDISIWTHTGLVQFIDLLCNYIAICSPILPTFNLFHYFPFQTVPEWICFAIEGMGTFRFTEC